jgi:GrxC family glutaredoxin
MKNIVIYSKDYCPYCDRAKNYFKSKNIAFKEIDVTHDEALFEEMLTKSNGRKTVPEIFIGDHHVGGWDDLNLLIQEGKLDDLLK